MIATKKMTEGADFATTLTFRLSPNYQLADLTSANAVAEIRHKPAITGSPALATVDSYEVDELEGITLTDTGEAQIKIDSATTSILAENLYEIDVYNERGVDLYLELKLEQDEVIKSVEHKILFKFEYAEFYDEPEGSGSGSGGSGE